MRPSVILLRLIVAIAIAASGSAAAWAQSGGPAPVAVSKVIERNVAEGQTFVGTVMPLKRATVGSAVDGRVIEFPVKQGDWVAAGQPLAQLLTETLGHELDAAKANLQLRKAELAELENGSRPEEIRQAKARMQAARAQMDFTQSKYLRTERLYTQGSSIVSKEQLDEALSQRINAEQSYLEAKEGHDLAVLGPRKEKIAQARAQVAEQQAVVERIADQIKKHTIISRFEG